MDTILEYKCPNCGGKVVFDSSTQKMKCSYCSTTYDVDTLKAYDDVLKNDHADQIQWDAQPSATWDSSETEGMNVYSCASCGGEIVADANTGATACPFCGNPVVIVGQFSGDLRPDYVIPFKLDKKTAKAALSEHFKKKPLLPKLFKDENHIDEIKGVYIPFWIFNADVSADIRYRASRIRAWSDSKYDYTETSFYSVLRSGELAFSAVPVDASSRIANDMMESIEPFDINEAVDFQTAYLSGYLADRYDVTADQSIEHANERIKKSTEAALSSTVHGFSSVVTEHSRISVKNGNIKYVLYPVWLLNTSWKGQKFEFAMNGQTGKFVGNLPVDKGLYARNFFFFASGIAAFIYAAMWLSVLL